MLLLTPLPRSVSTACSCCFRRIISGRFILVQPALGLSLASAALAHSRGGTADLIRIRCCAVSRHESGVSYSSVVIARLSFQLTLNWSLVPARVNLLRSSVLSTQSARLILLGLVIRGRVEERLRRGFRLLLLLDIGRGGRAGLRAQVGLGQGSIV